MVKTVAIACSREGLELVHDMPFLEEALQRCGLQPRRVQWNEDHPGEDHPGEEHPGRETISAVLVRQTWDYHLQPEAFTRWLQRLKAEGVPVFNGVETVLENMHKGYLLALQAQGFPIPATVRLEAGAAAVLPPALQAYETVIVKPAVSASSWRTFRIDTGDGDAFAEAVETIHRDGDALVQAFVPEIHHGEWSLLYLGGAFSFAVLKRPVPGEFRVQHEFGGEYTIASPPGELRDLADRLIAGHPRELAFARVDLVAAADGPLLMELELIEPDLMLRLHPPAADQLAEWLAARIPGRSP